MKESMEHSTKGLLASAVMRHYEEIKHLQFPNVVIVVTSDEAEGQVSVATTIGFADKIDILAGAIALRDAFEKYVEKYQSQLLCEGIAELIRGMKHAETSETSVSELIDKLRAKPND